MYSSILEALIDAEMPGLSIATLYPFATTPLPPQVPPLSSSTATPSLASVIAFLAALLALRAARTFLRGNFMGASFSGPGARLRWPVVSTGYSMRGSLVVNVFSVALCVCVNVGRWLA